MIKRAVLQAFAKFFDPIGLLSPFTTRAKIGFQRLWKMDGTWDDPIPSEERDKWKSLIEEAEQLKDPRTFRKKCFIKKTYPGRDGTIRSCLLRSSGKELLRRSTKHINPA